MAEGGKGEGGFLGVGRDSQGGEGGGKTGAGDNAGGTGGFG